MITIIEIVLVIAIIKWAFGKELISLGNKLHQWWSKLDGGSKSTIGWIALGVAVLSLVIWLGPLAWGAICLLWSKLTHDAQCVLSSIPVLGLLYLWAHLAYWMDHDNFFANFAKKFLIALVLCLILGCTISAIFGNLVTGYVVAGVVFLVFFLVALFTIDDY